jgi:hypothetical protein
LRPAIASLQVEFGNQELLGVEALGTARLECTTPNGTAEILLRNVRLIPGVSVNLASMTKLLEGGAEIQAAGNKMQTSLKGIVLMQAVNSNGILQILEDKAPDVAFSVREEKGAEIWH